MKASDSSQNKSWVDFMDELWNENFELTRKRRLYSPRGRDAKQVPAPEAVEGLALKRAGGLAVPGSTPRL